MLHHDVERASRTGSESNVCEHSAFPCRVCKQMSETPVIQAEELLRGHREVLILHAGQVYRLLRTRNDKLILQK